MGASRPAARSTNCWPPARKCGSSGRAGPSSAALGAGDSKSRELIYPYIIGDEILSGASGQTRFIPDFEQRNIIEAQAYPAAFAHVQTTVLPARQAATEAGKDAAGNIRSHHKAFLDRWWQLSWGRADMVAQLAKPPRYLACSRVTKRPIFAFINAAVRPGDALQVFAFADNYSFGILQSSTHWQWFVAKCSKLTERRDATGIQCLLAHEHHG